MDEIFSNTKQYFKAKGKKKTKTTHQAHIAKFCLAEMYRLF